MDTMVRLLSLGLLTLAAVSSASAGDVAPLSGKSFSLAAASGSLYYTAEAGGFRVVATVTASRETTPIRVSAVLNDGETLDFAVPGAFGTDASTVEIQRVGDRLMVIESDDSVIVADSEGLDETVTGGVSK